jgi:hypothetical protein
MGGARGIGKAVDSHQGGEIPQDEDRKSDHGQVEYRRIQGIREEGVREQIQSSCVIEKKAADRRPKMTRIVPSRRIK